MRPSTAVLENTAVRLADLNFPRTGVQIHRTRLAFIDIDRVIHFAKIDRDGKTDSYMAAYLPDELALLFLKDGEVVNAAAFTPVGRMVIPIAEALRRMRSDFERGELAFCNAPEEQLALMYQSCAAPARRKKLDEPTAEALLGSLEGEFFTGVVEVIARRGVNYFRVLDGRIVQAFRAQPDLPSDPKELLSALLQRRATGQVAVSTFPAADTLVHQASPAMISKFQAIYWKIVDTAETEVPGEAGTRAEKLKAKLSAGQVVLGAICTARDSGPPELVTTHEELTAALGNWTRLFLEELEIIAPGVAPDILKRATREQRFVLQKTGFFDLLPWDVRW